MGYKDVLGEELCSQIEAKLAEYNAGVTEKDKHMKLVDLSEGGYVSKGRYSDETKKLADQIAALKATVAERDASLKGLNEKLEAAGTDAAALKQLREDYAELEKKNAASAKDYEAKLAQLEYEQAVKSVVAGLKFSSKAAEKDFTRQAIEHGFKRNGDTLEGFNDFVDAYKAVDAGAFATEAPAVPPITTGGTGRTPGGQKMTLTELMKAKNADPNFVIDPNAFDVPTSL